MNTDMHKKTMQFLKNHANTIGSPCELPSYPCRGKKHVPYLGKQVPCVFLFSRGGTRNLGIPTRPSDPVMDLGFMGLKSSKVLKHRPNASTNTPFQVSE